MKRLLWAWIAALVLGGAALGAGVPAAAASLPAVAPVTPCQALRGFNPRLAAFPTQISDAREVEGQCRVQGYIAPQNRFEVRLPLKGWTQRYLQTGCGGLCGNLAIRSPQRDCPALTRGEFVTASTDMGHEGQGGQWGANDPQLRVDFAYRGVHATALVAKALIARYYGQPPRYSYFSGCSDGGREALMEAQRYPGDFDGIAAGAPAMNFLVQNSIHHGWQALTSMPGLKTSVLTAADMPALHAAAVAACDARDGVRDGLISDPLGCPFDPRTIACKPGESASCLSAAAADAAAKIYQGARDAQGRRLDVAGIMPGSELAWPGVAVARAPGSAGGPPGSPPAGPNERPGSAMFAADTVQWLAYPQPLGPDWTLADFRFDAASFDALRPMHSVYDSTDPDLSRFAARGGRLLVWHGLQDQHISPGNSVAFAQAVSDTMGAGPAGNVLRTFLMPGMYHCGSGDGMTSIDVLTPLMAWVEDGRAPDAIVASRSDSDAAAGKGRPVFAWPATARLRPGADAENPANWTRGPAAVVPKLYAQWLGADFYKPGGARDCGFDGERWQCRVAQ